MRWEMRGSHSMRIIPRKKILKFFGDRPSLGYKALSAGTGPHSFPVKPSESPVFRTSPSKGYNTSTKPQKALKSPRLHRLSLGTCTRLRPDLHPDLHPFCPKHPVFQHFLDCVLANPRDFGDQIPVFARLSCIGKGLSKNMARILRGVKSPFASSARGGGLFSFLPSPCPCAIPLQAVGLPSLQFFAVGRGHF